MCEADLLAIQFDQFGLDGRVQPLSRIGDIGAFDEIQSWLRERGGHKQDILHPRWERRQPFVEQLLQPARDRKSLARGQPVFPLLQSTRKLECKERIATRGFV